MDFTIRRGEGFIVENIVKGDLKVVEHLNCYFIMKIKAQHSILRITTDTVESIHKI